jgi:hypothetical protein
MGYDFLLRILFPFHIPENLLTESSIRRFGENTYPFQPSSSLAKSCFGSPKALIASSSFQKPTHFCGGIATVSRPVWSRKGSSAPARPCSIFHSLGRLTVSISNTFSVRGPGLNQFSNVSHKLNLCACQSFCSEILGFWSLNGEVMQVDRGYPQQPSSVPWSKDP